MSKCCGSNPTPSSGDSATPLNWFSGMLPRCLDAAKVHHEKGRPLVGIMCEFTPREIILAAGALPVCLCGGSGATIADAEKDLPANLCPLIKSTYGYHAQKTNPFLEMADLIVAETTCDGKKKMFELMGETRPMHVLELPQKPDDPDAFHHWIREIEKLKTELERRFDVQITDEKLREASAVMNRERALRRRLAKFMKQSAPPLTGRELITLKSTISAIPADLEQYEKAIDYLETRAPLPNIERRPRVLLTGVPMAHGAERVLEIIENAGGLVVAQENCTGLKPIMDDVDLNTDDPLAAIAEKYIHLPCSVMTRNDRRFDLLAKLAKDYSADCIIDLVWQACLTYDVETNQVRRLSEERLGLPYLRIETDYSPSDTARLNIRIEALFETIQAASQH